MGGWGQAENMQYGYDVLHLVRSGGILSFGFLHLPRSIVVHSEGILILSWGGGLSPLDFDLPPSSLSSYASVYYHFSCGNWRYYYQVGIIIVHKIAIALGLSL